MPMGDRLRQYAGLGRDMRRAQRAYFAAKRRGLDGGAELGESKRLEKDFDAATDDVLGGPTLFDACPIVDPERLAIATELLREWSTAYAFNGDGLVGRTIDFLNATEGKHETA